MGISGSRCRRPTGGFTRDKDGGAPSANSLSILGEGRFWGHQLSTQRPALCPAKATAPRQRVITLTVSRH